MISKEQVKHIAKLAKLSLTEKEVEKFQKQLGDTLDYINVLDELNVEGVEPTSQVTGLKNILREDKSVKSLSQQEALLSAESKCDNCFKVKPILKK